jgi:cytochrome c biogenesis protein CcmG, thiol:disulfide interchange protein DsbE
LPVRIGLATVAFLAAFACPAASADPGKPLDGISGRDPRTGALVTLDQWKGRPVAINVWASWCEGCKQEAAALKRFEEAHPRSVLGIDYNDSRVGARYFYEKYDLEHPSIFDPKGRLVRKVKAVGLPSTVFLNRRHVVVYAIAGAATLAQFNEGWRKATS